MNEETQRWKNKYLNKLDEADSLKASFAGQKAILERLLVRVSLAAEGHNKQLDDELASLRSAVRQENTDTAELSRRLEAIEKLVLAMDQAREDAAGGLLKSLTQLAEQLLSFGSSREQKKLLKNFRKKLAASVSDERLQPGLLAELCTVQGDILRTLAHHEDKGRQGHFLNRLFKSKDAGNHQVQSVDRELAALQDNSESLPGNADLNLQTASAQQTEPGFAAIAEHVCSTLDNLVEHLQFPESMDQDALRIREQVARGLSWHELVPALDDITNLVIAALGKGQKDFESFLKSLDARLVSIQSFLEMNRSSHNQAAKNKAELHQEMHAHLTSIQEDVNETGDFNALKSRVQADLDAMLISLERYMRKESSREQDMVAEMADLQTRLQAMESDSMEMQQQLAEQQQKAMTDGLTGLPNRVAYENRVQLEFERWRRYRNPLTLVVADIDRFKLVNDQYGHLSGDKVIQLIGKEVANRIRKTDFMARYGGEEFVILLPETQAEVAFSVMNKTREMISRMPFHFQNQKVQVTISMGLCEFHEGAGVQEIFALADKALYMAKSAGRNQVHVAESSKW